MLQGMRLMTFQNQHLDGWWINMADLRYEKVYCYAARLRKIAKMSVMNGCEVCPAKQYCEKVNGGVRIDLNKCKETCVEWCLAK